MVKKRIYELAKELNIESKDIINKLKDIGLEEKKPASALEDDQIAHIMKTFGPAREAGNKTAKPGEPQSGYQAAQGHSPGEQSPQRAGGPKQPLQRESAPPKQSGQYDRTRQPSNDSRRRSDHKQGGHKMDRGPGLVDRVPSRPPDRRFEERPSRPGMQGRPAQPPKGAGRPPGVPADKGAPAEEPARIHQAPAERQQPEKEAAAAQTGPAPKEQKQNEMARRPDGHPPARTYPAANNINNAPRQGNPAQTRTPSGQDRGGYGGRARPQGGQGGQQNFRKPYSGGDRGQFQGNRPPQGDGKPPFKGREGQGPRPYGGGDQGNRPPARPQGQRPAGGPGGARPRPDQLKVPKVPEQAKDLDKVKASEKSRNRVQQNQNKNQNQGKGREKARTFNDFDERKLRPAHSKKKAPKQVSREAQPAPVVEKKPVVIGESATVQELAEKMKKSPAELIKRLMVLGVLATINQEIDVDTAAILAGEFGFEIEVKVELDAEALLEQEQEDPPEKLVERPCVVTVMGHVDHGKTSLLDAIRETNVIATEAGGITQHIGAYQVEHNNKKITFVDTPGHEAFTAMRARGAQVTDIAILVVAADDGVMPQTIEAINHAKAAGVPIIVAINKIDKLGAEPDRVKQQLTEHELVPEEWGGETIFVPVSAKTREGMEDLLEMILLVSEVGELKANPDRGARGTVIEAELDKGRGPVATVLVQNGTLRIGDSIVAGTAFGKVRAMMDDKGRRIKKAGPSTPVEVLGFHDVPQAGDLFYALEDEKTARNIADKRITRKRQEEMKQTSRVTLDDLFKHIQEGQVKELCLIIKADVQGSVEAVKQSLERLSTGEVKVNIIHGGVGAITESDIMLASASNAIIIGFNVRPDINVRKAAEAEKVDIRLYRVIYDAIEDVKAAMSGLLDPEIKEVILGRVEVRKTFKVSKLGIIAGCYVVEGKVTRDAGVRLIRDGVVVHEGRLDSLKRFKDDAREVLQGFECGLTLDRFNDIHVGDTIEAYTTESIKRELA
ncbi:translation initiation factor 2 [Desulfocucumis palustris]|uniref:Translation initiation factor IF-2 n=1 Tax=Desulfocucumis palustris TaxID=1898651 RepID=A0A2L2X905_9FIRM|nr:translation initiation factor IF-2 [Desulfocucumis palustris]GBF32675.1 translation initiation factor 2 [Desulfocucumis palustris]